MTISEELKKAIDRLQIRDVVVKSLTCSLNSNVVPGLSGHVLSESIPSFRTRGPACMSITEYTSEEDVVHVYETRAGIQLFARDLSNEGMSLSEEEVQSNVLGEIEAYFFVSYTEALGDFERLTEESLGEFAQRNVPFNVWPYWRELVQTATSRMGLPRVVLPARHFRPRSIKAAWLSDESNTPEEKVSRVNE